MTILKNKIKFGRLKWKILNLRDQNENRQKLYRSKYNLVLEICVVLTRVHMMLLLNACQKVPCLYLHVIT